MSGFITDANRKWWILAAMSAGMAMSFIDQTALAVTLPSLQRSFHTSAIALQWVIDIYLLMTAILVAISGRLGDLFGYRRLYLIGTTIFLMASVLCAVAPDIGWLITSRALQGIGAALLIPSASVLTLNAFEPHERGKAMGISVGFASLFLASGPFLGGLFTQLMSWRLVFWINVPLCSVILLIVYYIIPASSVNTSHKKSDWFGFAALIIATSSLVIALMEGANLGWTSSAIVSLLATAVFFAAWLYRHEKYIANPLLDFNIFQNKIFSNAAAIYFCMQIALMSTVFSAIFNQEVLGFKPVIAGLLALPGTLPVVFIGPIAGNMLDKSGVRKPVVMGLALTVIGMTLNGFLAYYQRYIYLLPGMLCNGFGVPLIMSPLGTAAIISINRAQQGIASGLLNATRQLGSCIGLALLSAIIIGYNRYKIAGLLATSPQPAPQWTVQKIERLLLHPASPQFADWQMIAKTSFTAAYSLGLHVCALIAMIALVIAWYLPKRTEK